MIITVAWTGCRWVLGVGSSRGLGRYRDRPDRADAGRSARQLWSVPCWLKTSAVAVEVLSHCDSNASGTYGERRLVQRLRVDILIHHGGA